MKRITYISRLAESLTLEEVEAISTISGENNRQYNITGLLVYFEKMFFQIIEGDDQTVDQLYLKIGKDPRHTDILRLKTEYDVGERLFPSWSMKTINLDQQVDDLLLPIKILLQTVIESHSIIEQYTQPTIIKMLNKGINPLKVEPVPLEKVILFTDIISYSSISEKLPIKETLLILNTYFEICSRIILQHGGEVNKFLGDGLMAYFDIAQSDNAIEACLQVLEELRQLRTTVSPDSPLRLLYSGFGLSQGSVIEGNMGSHFKTDYTIIGDAVNIASRLQEMTREVQYALVLSESLRQRTSKTWPFVSLGQYHLKGKKHKSEIYAIDHPLVSEFTANIFLEY